MKNWVSFFASRHALTNLLFIGTLIAGWVSWNRIGKEEMPDFEMNRLTVVAPYPGATADDVETLVTIPLERELKGITGIEEVRANSSTGVSSISLEISPKEKENFNEILVNIRDASERANIPGEVRDDLSYRQFKTSEKAILDIGLIDKNHRYLDYESRAQLEEVARGLEDRLTSLPEISSVDISGSKKRELQILIDHERLKELSIPLGHLLNVLRSAHVVAPSGSMEDKNETKVSVIADYSDPEKLKNLVIRTNEVGRLIRLNQVADVKFGFEKNDFIQKLQGFETIIINVKKSTSVDILKARAAVLKSLERFGTPKSVEYKIMDDESYDVRNRLKIISSNGVLGFVLILIVLLIFLDFKSGLWTASGLPFALCFTLVIALLCGYTVNNVTLAAIIIVLGIVVDDAIIIAENVARLRHQGLSSIEASIKGAQEMALPIIAAILTTCAAFMPLLFLSGHFGAFISYMPLLVCAMLGASLLESLFILPSHLTLGKASQPHTHWFEKYENRYATFLEKLLQKRVWVVLVFVLFLVGSCILFVTQMKFVMFPREEGRQTFLRVEAIENLNRMEMAKALEKVEAAILEGTENEIVAMRSWVARSRRGGNVKENEASISIELHPKGKRETPLKVLINNWEKKFEPLTEFKKIKFIKRRFGSNSGSPLEVEIRESDDKKRLEVASLLKAELESIDGITNVEVDEPLRKINYEITPKQAELMLSDIDASVLSSNTRTYLNGSEVYSFTKNDEEIETIVELAPSAKRKVSQIGDLLVENKLGNLVRMSRLIDIKEVLKPTSIQRINFKRTTRVFADFAPDNQKTPIEVAEIVEGDFFESMQEQFPSVQLQFRGEVEDSRESKGDLMLAILIVVGLIYGILLILFNSLLRPFIILLVVPFGLVGVILAFYLHGYHQFGFLAVVGSLGMIGVVVNDSIVLLSKLQNGAPENLGLLSKIVSTRLRAIVVTTLTTVAGIFPTAYGVFGFDSMLAEMMLAMGWGLLLGTCITLILTPCLYSLFARVPNR